MVVVGYGTQKKLNLTAAVDQVTSEALENRSVPNVTQGLQGVMPNNPATPTIPSNNPQRCIDFIFAANFNGHNFETIQTVVEQEPMASDHLPVWVVAKFK